MNKMRRTIRSYVLRAGRMSDRQADGLHRALSLYTIPCDHGIWDFQEIYSRQTDTILEIGFGMGASLFEMAQASLDKNFIGIEVHRSGVGALAKQVEEAQLTNLRIVMADAVSVLNEHIADYSLTGIQIFFPDPWHKKKHHKRRLIQPDFVALLSRKLKPGGWLHCATDWEDYAHHMLNVLSQEPSLQNMAVSGNFIPKPATRPMTKFEQRGIDLGHGVWDLMFLKK